MRVTPRTLVALGAITLSLGNLGRIPGGSLGGRSAPIVLGDLLLLPLWLTLITVLVRRLRPWPLDGVTKWVLAFVLVAVLSLVNASALWGLGVTGTFGPAAFLVRWVLYAGWFWLVTVCLNADDAHASVAVIERGLLAIAAFGIIQSAFLPGFAQMVTWGGGNLRWDEQGNRLVSTLLDPNFAGILIVIALLLELARDAEQMPTRLGRLLVLGVAVLLTLSRSSILAFLVGVTALLVVRGVRRKLVGLLLAGGVALVPFLALLLSFAASFHKLGIDGSATQRLIPWTRSLTMIADHPWLGVGFNAVPAAQAAYGWKAIGGADVSLDGGLLFVATMTGIPGVVLYTGLIVSALLTCRLVWRRAQEPRARALAAGTAAATVAVLVHSLFTNSLLLPFVMQVLWLLWGAVTVAARPVRLAMAAPPTIAVASLPAGARSAIQGATLLTAALLLSGCDPCSGALMCSTQPTIALSGQIVEPVSGAPVRGAVVTVQDVQAVTESNGRWELVLLAAAGVTQLDVTVKAPQLAPYTVRGVPVHPQTRRGEVQELGRWNSRPTARYQATLQRNGAPVAGAAVSFTSQSGVAATMIGGPSSTNSGGIFTMFLAGAGEVGNAIGTLTVSHPSFSRPTQLQGFAIPVTSLWDLPAPTGPFPVGGRLDFGGIVHFRGTGSGASGARLTFTRTGGLELQNPVLLTQANETGFFALPMRAETYGTVIGDLAIETADGRQRSMHRDVRFSSYDSTAMRFAGTWGVGEHWAYAFELWTNAVLRPAAGVRVDIRRIGGLNISPSVVSTRTDQTGRVEWRPTVQDTGTVELEMVVFPDGGPPRAIRNLRFRTFDSDELRFAGVFGFGPALRYVVEIKDAADHLVPGAVVTWTQTGGPSASPATYTATSGSDGWVRLTLVPSADGDVIGDLSIVPPSPWRAGTVFRVPNFHLRTWEDGDLRYAFSYRLPPP